MNKIVSMKMWVFIAFYLGSMMPIAIALVVK